MISTFAGCSNLQTVNMSTFETKPVTSLKNVFLNCTSLTNVDMGNMNFSDNVTVVDALKNVKNNCTFIVKDNTIKNKLSSTTSSTISFQIN